jgi:hypothetical protein
MFRDLACSGRTPAGIWRQRTLDAPRDILLEPGDISTLAQRQSLTFALGPDVSALQRLRFRC